MTFLWDSKLFCCFIPSVSAFCQNSFGRWERWFWCSSKKSEFRKLVNSFVVHVYHFETNNSTIIFDRLILSRNSAHRGTSTVWTDLNPGKIRGWATDEITYFDPFFNNIWQPLIRFVCIEYTQIVSTAVRYYWRMDPNNNVYWHCYQTLIANISLFLCSRYIPLFWIASSIAMNASFVWITYESKKRKQEEEKPTS